MQNTLFLLLFTATLSTRCTPDLLIAEIEKETLTSEINPELLTDLNTLSQDGYLPLIEAIETRRPSLVRLLLEHGADPNKRDQYNSFPLETLLLDSSPLNFRNIQEILIQHGARQENVSFAGKSTAIISDAMNTQVTHPYQPRQRTSNPASSAESAQNESANSLLSAGQVTELTDTAQTASIAPSAEKANRASVPQASPALAEQVVNQPHVQPTQQLSIFKRLYNKLGFPRMLLACFLVAAIVTKILLHSQNLFKSTTEGGHNYTESFFKSYCNPNNNPSSNL